MMGFSTFKGITNTGKSFHGWKGIKFSIGRLFKFEISFTFPKKI